MTGVPMYAVAIHEAVKSGNINAMKTVLAEAEAYLKDHGDVSAALELLKVEIARIKHKAGPIPLYGVVIHEAIAAGDVERMKEVLAAAEAQLAESGDVRAALTALRAALSE